MPHDFERGAKVTGSKFYFTTGEAALAEWELINKMIEFHTKNGYQFVIPPYLVNKQTATQSGILPKFEGEYYQTQEGLILVPTAETPLVGMHSDEIFREEELPIKYVAFSPCFRKEAGAAGQRDKGLKRVHQFHKVELFVICTPEQSEQLHEEMVHQVKRLLKEFAKTFDEDMFEIREIELEPHDRAPWSNKTVDIEITAINGEWLEVSSISNTGDNQSKIAQIRYKPKKGGKNVKCHLLNGSGVALPRLKMAMGITEGDK